MPKPPPVEQPRSGVSKPRRSICHALTRVALSPLAIARVVLDAAEGSEDRVGGGQGDERLAGLDGAGR
jgi:hypothetical protein